ncbi:efflux RND transporter periplasmic adaptor subunit [Cognatishimia activa]|uniref:efflux RND transporter periplasmic adaptor subunit n=1 Tax=Cognatishimia activa TaxID=1715691 RepID=UPI0022310D8D|nr:biotin/lipoyl-binding protein [Cognatishimia activa]UZD90314.1 hypothetical protein M0D42_12055 [Cognatishimia activa]
MIGRVVWILPPLLAGAAVFIWMTRPGETLSQEAVEPKPLPVRVEVIEPIVFQPQAVGYGYVQPVRSWKAVAQVSGRILRLDPSIEEGAFIASGALAVEVDPQDYEVALSIADAALAEAEISLAELSASEANTRRTLALEKELEAVFAVEVDRQQSLVDRGSSTQTAVESARRSLLGQQRTVLSLENTLALLPVQTQSLEAAIKTRRAEVENARNILSTTKLNVPFEGRVQEVAVAVDQFIRAGDTLFSLDDISASNIVAEFQPAQLSDLFSSAETLSVAELIDPQDAREVFSVVQAMDLSATVRLTVGDLIHEWDADLVRIIGITSAETGTVGIVVRVANPGDIDPSKQRPPLSNDAFVEVRLTSQPLPDVTLIERDAVRYGVDGQPFAYVADETDRLDIRALKLGAVSGDYILVSEGLERGDLIVLSDPQPAVLGMPLAAVSAE